MEITFSPGAKNDIAFWKKTGDVIVMKRIAKLLSSISSTPFEGVGKPEPLKYELSGYWSRRITKEHRLVYKVENNEIEVISLRFHY